MRQESYRIRELQSELPRFESDFRHAGKQENTIRTYLESLPASPGG
jgi:hypothetical protein